MGGVYSVKPPMTSDSELLRQYANQGDELAFTEVVRRHTDLVYSIALRLTRDAALAQDTTQNVFTKLAQAAKVLCGYPTPIGWLHTITRHTAINAIRAEARRRAREHESFTMQNISSHSTENWEQLGPILDEAVSRLRERDRQAVLLRFFNGLSHQEVGTVLGLTENSAQKCVDRALEKLRRQFARRGVTVSSALLATTMGANSVQAAPVGLAARAAETSLVNVGAGASFGSTLLLTLFMSTKIKIILAIIFVAILAGGIWWFPQPTAVTPEKTAPRMTPAQAAAPKSAVAMEAPKLRPANPSATANAAPADALPITIAPDGQREEISEAIDNIVARLQAGDVEGVMRNYFSDWDFKTQYARAKWPTEAEWVQLLDKYNKQMVVMLQSLKTTTPEYARAPQGGDFYYYDIVDPVTGHTTKFDLYKSEYGWSFNFSVLQRWDTEAKLPAQP